MTTELSQQMIYTHLQSKDFHSGFMPWQEVQDSRGADRLPRCCLQEGGSQWCVLALVHRVRADIGLGVAGETLWESFLATPPHSLLPSPLPNSSFKSQIHFHPLHEAFPDPSELG